MTTDPAVKLIALDDDAYKHGRETPIDLPGALRQRTTRGGYHHIYRAPVDLRLADTGTPGVECVKGGCGQGYVVGCGSQVRTEAGVGYYRLDGGPDTPPMIPAALAERHAAADRADASPAVDGAERPVDGAGGGIADRFNRAAAWPEILLPAGWEYVGVGSRGEGQWRRPDKADRGISATTNATGRDTLIVFSTFTAFDTAPCSYSKFAAYAVLHYGGDFTAAARALHDAEHLPPVESPDPAWDPLAGDAYADPPAIPELPAAVPNGHRPPADVDPATGEIPTPAVPSNDDTFWAARPVLTYVRDVARAARVAPDALLGCLLGEVLAQVEPSITLPPIGALGATDGGSLNTIHLLVGESSDGKGRARSAARRIFGWSNVHEGRPRSGEGLVDLFATRVKDPGGEWRTMTRRTRAVLYYPEISMLTAVVERSGNTLQAELLQAYAGEPLGGECRTPEKNVTVAAHRYRLTMIVGAQPEGCGPLLDGAAACRNGCCGGGPTTQTCPMCGPTRRRRWHGGCPTCPGWPRTG